MQTDHDTDARLFLHTLISLLGITTRKMDERDTVVKLEEPPTNVSEETRASVIPFNRVVDRLNEREQTVVQQRETIQDLKQIISTQEDQIQMQQETIILRGERLQMQHEINIMNEKMI